MSANFRELTFVALTCWLAGTGWADCRPETWFHIIGGNASKAGLTADLEAIRNAGFSGIQFFHGRGAAWEGVDRQIPCLSANWDGLVRHAAEECRRLGLSFRMQNCPGWSMSGGPWIRPSEAMRKIVRVRRFVTGGRVPGIEVPEKYRDEASDWQDVALLAYPTPIGESEEPLTPVSVTTNGTVRVFRFAEPVTARTLQLPSPRSIVGDWCYNPDVAVLLEARTTSGWRVIRQTAYPGGCWQDDTPLSLACEEVESGEFRLTLRSDKLQRLGYARFLTDALGDSWEGESALVLRGHVRDDPPARDPAAIVPRNGVREVRPGDPLPDGKWTVVRLGHVNMKLVNAPAPPEATGWECDKLDPRGVEANFAGYIGRLVQGPLKGGLLRGMIVDSWECTRQTWTWKLEEYFRDRNGYAPRRMLPALFGTIIGSPEETDRFLLDWRGTIGALIAKNYYGRMSELAHASGLDVAYESALGDAAVGDPLEYWKHCDTPMCEYWRAAERKNGGVGHPNFKPVRPCVSAAHIYGKRRVAAESFTDMALCWDESLHELKARAVDHFAKGVTHTVTHTYTHDPRKDGKAPGTSFGTIIGSPFLRGQTWWSFMPAFTGWLADCCAFLERGHAVVDVLRYIGDDVGPRPDELEYFPDGYKCDFLNPDALRSRVSVASDGRFVLPDGMSYARVWIPPGTFLLPEAKRLLDKMSAQGGAVVYGTADEAVKGLRPQLAVDTSQASRGEILWYHRLDGDSDCYFLAAGTNGFRGTVMLRLQRGTSSMDLDLAPSETRLVEANGPSPAGGNAVDWTDLHMPLTFSLSFPPGWGTPGRPIELENLAPWKDIPGLSEEGRSFSGTATYSATFDLPTGVRRLRLDLGGLRDCARVFVNGKLAAELWSEPWRCEISDFARAGRNDLKIEVTSSWFNRLVYDKRQSDDKRKTWTVWDVVKDEPLRPSGLFGPVRLQGVADETGDCTDGNLILNGKFEADQVEYPPYWTPSTTDRYFVRSSGGPKGLPCVSIVGRGHAEDENCVRQSGIKLVDGGRYRLSALVRTKGFSARSSSVCIGDTAMKRTVHAGRVPPDTNGEWVRLSTNFTCFASADGRYVALFYVNGSSGVFDLADVRLEPLDERARMGSEVSSVMAGQNRPRLVPYSVLMKLTRGRPKALFRFFGRLSEGELSDYDVALAVKGMPGESRCPLSREDMALALPAAAEKGELAVAVVRRRDGARIVESTYPFDTVVRESPDALRPFLTRHRRLNNLATEVLSEPCKPGENESVFVTRRNGWVYISVGPGASALMDGSQVIAADTPRSETIRWIKAGRHRLMVRSTKASGRVIVRSIAEIYDFCACYDNCVTLNGKYDWDFAEQHVLPAVTVLNCGNIPRERQGELRTRGYHWIGNTWTRTFTPAELVRNLETCEGVAKDCFDGVSCDEIFFAQAQQVDAFTQGLWDYARLHPDSPKLIYTWIVGKPSAAGMDHDFLASAVNASRGDGRLLVEAYCRSKSSESEAWDYARGYFCDTVAQFRSWYPRAVPATSVVLGNFNQIPCLSLAHHPDVDYKYFLDIQMNLLANDSTCRGIGGVGYWGSHQSDEELHRWSFALTRHYVIEGRTNLLSRSYGFAYRPGHVRNGDFVGSLDPWKVSGDVVAGSHDGLAAKIEMRWGGNGGVGDTFAAFARRADEISSVSQTLSGLVPGRTYRIRLVSFDLKDVRGGKRASRRLGIDAHVTGAVKIDPSRTSVYVDDHRRWSNDDVPRVNFHQIVFTAKARTAELAIDNASARPGDELGVNYVSVTPYFEPNSKQERK